MSNMILQELLECSFTPWSDSEDSTSSQTSLEEVITPPRKRRRRCENYVENVVALYSEQEFKSHFRMTRSTVDKIIHLLESSNLLPSHLFGRDKISAKKACLLSIWYLCNLETFRQVSDRFNVSYSSAHRCLRRVIKFFLSMKTVIIKWPTEEEAEVIKEEFRKKKGIQNVIGAIDGSHIEIVKPIKEQNAYCNRKGYHSLLLQGISDSNKKFIDVYCGEPGSIHDARLLRKSGIYAKMINDPNFMGNNFIIGDSAYPNLHWLVTPFRDNGHLTRNQQIFNYKLSATRIVIENAFGLLKGRFRRLRKLDNIDKRLCSEIIMTCCILNNICIDERDFVDTEITDCNQPATIAFNSTTNITEHVNRQQEVFHQMLLECT